VNVARLRVELKYFPDSNFTAFLCDSFQSGFDTLVTSFPIDNKECKNLQSAITQPQIVSGLIQQECEKGFLLGLFVTPPFRTYRISPIGITTGKYSGKHRLIVDLSSPHNDSSAVSLNDLIDKDECSLSYVKIDDAIKIIQKYGRGSLLCKTDISDAFKLCPIKKSQWHLFGIQWHNKYYFYHRLVFGCRSSPKLFDFLSDTICWIAQNNYGIKAIMHLLDDFLTIDKPHDCGERTMALLTCIFHRLNIPLSKSKTMGPTTELEYLGIILDTDRMEARLPLDKISRIINFLTDLLHKTSCTKLTLLQLLGHLNFASRVILPGRSFVSYLIALSTTVTKLHYRVTLTAECRHDIDMWLRFLNNWNGVSVFYDIGVTMAPDMHLYTDASSTVGFGGFFNGEWFAERWPPSVISELQKQYTISMAYMELYPIVVSAILWGGEWTQKKILFHCDNTGTVEIIKKGRSKSPIIMTLMRRLTWCALKGNFTIYATHIAGKSNTIADYLSRLQISKFRTAAPNANQEPIPCPPHSEIMWY